MTTFKMHSTEFLSMTSRTTMLSTDGNCIVFAGSDKDQTQLWLRPLADLQVRRLEGTEHAGYPFWSPDSRHIGFFADGKLKRVPASGGPAVILADARAGRGGAWSDEGGGDGTIIFARVAQGEGLVRIPAAGGTPVTLTTLGQQDHAHRQPKFLPGGKRFLFAGLGRDSWIGWADLSSNPSKPLRFMDGNHADYAPAGKNGMQGHIVFARGDGVMARRLDGNTMQFRGEPFQVAPAVEMSGPRNVADVSVAAGGLMLYRPIPAVRSEIAWLDRTGRPLAVLPETANAVSVSLSPAADRALIMIRPPGQNMKLSVYDLDRRVANPLATAGGTDGQFGDVWSPDGRSLAYAGTKRLGNRNSFATQTRAGQKRKSWPLVRFMVVRLRIDRCPGCRMEITCSS